MFAHAFSNEFLTKKRKQKLRIFFPKFWNHINILPLYSAHIYNSNTLIARETKTKQKKTFIPIGNMVGIACVMCVCVCVNFYLYTQTYRI